MSYTIAVAGKGGTGKTTVCALLMAELLQRGKGPILAVDADPNANLGPVLGVEPAASVGAIREQALGSINAVPTGMSKEDFLEYHIQSALVEAEGFDLITMGRPEGLGCYCYANNLIRKIMDNLSENYPFMLIDNEAGMEHLSRRTTRDVDLLLLVADASLRGLKTVLKIAAMADELKLNIHRKGVIINRLPERSQQDYASLLQEHGLELLALIPHDPELQQQDIEGIPLLQLPASTPARRALESLLSDLAL